MIGPVFNLLYFKNILDRCVRRFFEERNSEFAKSGDVYVYSGNGDTAAFERYLAETARQEILAHVRRWDIMKPERFFIIGGCEPRDNMLLDFAGGDFPVRLRKAIWSDDPVKYGLKEKDIVFGRRELNEAAERVFSGYFSGGKSLGAGYGNVIFVRHRRLDCYTMFKTLKYILGRSSCVNTFIEEFKGEPQCLVSANDLIDRYVNRKTEMNRSPEYRKAVDEIRRFIEEKFKEI